MAEAKRRALIAGGSLAGLFAGLLLRRAGWEATIFERSPKGLEGRGAGIVTHGSLLSAVAACGVDGLSSPGVPVPGRVVLARDGSRVAQYCLRQTFTSWSRIYGALLAQFPPANYRLGRTLKGYTQDARSITAFFADGSPETGDLLIGADGINSAVRGQFLPKVQPLYAGYVAWRGLVAESELSVETRSALMDRLGFCLPEGEQMLGYPVPGASDRIVPGQRRYNFVWYRPASQGIDLTRLYTDAQGTSRQTPPPPGQIHPRVIAAMRADASRLLAPQFAEVVARTAEPFVQAIHDLESPRLTDGRAVLTGDAGFVARPHVGMGVSKAAGDAAALAGALSGPGDWKSALSQFERERLDFGRIVVAQARRLGAYMQAQIDTPEERAMAEAHRTVSSVIAETASSAFLSSK